MRIDVNKQWQVYLDFGRAGSLSLVIFNLPQIIAFERSSEKSCLPVYKTNRIASLPCIFETIISDAFAIIYKTLVMHVYTVIKRGKPGRVAQSVTCLATDACLTADPGVASSIPVRSHTFVEIDH